jgi:hypothetical protein
MSTTRAAFSRFILFTLATWSVISGLLVIACVFGDVSVWQTGIAVALLTLVAFIRIYDEYRANPILPKGFEYVGNHLVTPNGVFCRKCHTASAIESRHPYKDRKDRTFIYVYKCGNCGRTSYIDEPTLDGEKKEC